MCACMYAYYTCTNEAQMVVRWFSMVDEGPKLCTRTSYCLHETATVACLLLLCVSHFKFKLLQWSGMLIDVECACTPQCLEWEAAVLRSIAGMHVTKRVCVQLVMHSYQGVFVPVVCVMADLIL